MTAILDDLASKNPEKLDWRKSIVDLMKLVGMDSSLASRKELAKDLNYTGDTGDSAAMNIWLHKVVIRKIADNGGKVPNERLKPPISVAGKKPEEVKAEVVAQLGKISAILEGKVPADQAEGYKSWLVAIAGKVANASTEGGFFGFGGEKVSAAETAAINELASSLGVKV